jgi:hypothetical protein
VQTIASASTAEPRRAWWAPRRLGWWVGALFAVGSACFLVGPLPGFVELVGSAVDAAIFFVGSVFFTAAALLQTVQSEDGLDRWACAVQLAGTVFFNASTYHALRAGLDANAYDRLVWAPDLLGSICFLVSGVLAWRLVSGRVRRDPERRIAGVNLIGCVAFGIAAVAAYVVPTTGTALDLAAANVWTALGALCFLVGALLLLPVAARE